MLRNRPYDLSGNVKGTGAFVIQLDAEETNKSLSKGTVMTSFKSNNSLIVTYLAQFLHILCIIKDKKQSVGVT